MTRHGAAMRPHHATLRRPRGGRSAWRPRGWVSMEHGSGDHEQQRGEYTNVYLDKVEAAPAKAGGVSTWTPTRKKRSSRSRRGSPRTSKESDGDQQQGPRRGAELSGSLRRDRSGHGHAGTRREARRASLPLVTRVVASAARRGLTESREGVQVAHERVAADVGRRALRRLGNRVRRGAHEPRQERLILGVVVAVGAL
jgi:hypothetical protein